MSLSLTLDGQPVVGYSNLRVKSVARGGFASVEFNMTRKLDKSLLATFTDVMVYDTATGEQVGGGRLMEQGRNDDGTWGITCLGEGLASMQDVTAPIAYVDQSTGSFFLKERSNKRQKASLTQYPGQTDDDPVMVWEADEDKTIHTNASVVMVYPGAELCGMQAGGIGFRHKSGVTIGDMLVRVWAGTVASPLGLKLYEGSYNSTISSRIVRGRGGSLTGDRTAFAVQWFANIGIVGHDGDTSYVTEDFWSAVRDTVIRTQIYGSDGLLKTTGYTNEYVLGSEVFTDLVVRRCPRLSVGTVQSTSEHIEQMVYLDGIHAMDVMDDVLEIERAFNWDVYEQGDDGKWPANLTSYPTTVRYEASTEDGFQAPSPTTEIYNKVTVTGKSPGGRDVNVTRTQVVPELDDAGIVRHATIAFGGEVWSTSAANKAGDDFLAEHKVAPNAGTLTVARKIRDNLTGRYVSPVHIRPNELVRVRGVQPTPDTLNANSPDGVTVFYIQSMTYSDDDGRAVLELDQLELTTARALTKLARKRTRR